MGARRDEGTQRSAQATRSGDRPKLVVLSNGRLDVHEWPKNGEMTLGRGAECDVRTDDVSVSRAHAKIRANNGSFTIEDLGSSNGTHVGASAIAPRKRVPLTPFQLG